MKRLKKGISLVDFRMRFGIIFKQNFHYGISTVSKAWFCCCYQFQYFEEFKVLVRAGATGAFSSPEIRQRVRRTRSEGLEDGFDHNLKREFKEFYVFTGLQVKDPEIYEK